MNPAVELLCYAIGQGNKAKIANRLQQGMNRDHMSYEDKLFLDAKGVGTVGEHIEALRITLIRFVKLMPEDEREELIEALEEQGLTLNPDTNEGGKP